MLGPFLLPSSGASCRRASRRQGDEPGTTTTLEHVYHWRRLPFGKGGPIPAANVGEALPGCLIPSARRHVSGRGCETLTPSDADCMASAMLRLIGSASTGDRRRRPGPHGCRTRPAASDNDWQPWLSLMNNYIYRPVQQTHWFPGATPFRRSVARIRPLQGRRLGTCWVRVRSRILPCSLQLAVTPWP